MREMIHSARGRCGARALDRVVAEHAVALELLPAHSFVLEVVQEIQRVDRLADLAQRLYSASRRNPMSASTASRRASSSS